MTRKTTIKMLFKWVLLLFVIIQTDCQKSNITVLKCCEKGQILNVTEETNDYSCSFGDDVLPIIYSPSKLVFMPQVPVNWVVKSAYPDCGSNRVEFVRNGENSLSLNFLLIENGDLQLIDSNQYVKAGKYCFSSKTAMICTNKPPEVKVKKCCGHGAVFSEVKQGCLPMNVTDYQIDIGPGQKFVEGFPHCNSELLITVGKLHEAELFPNGSLKLPKVNTVLKQGTFCLEHVLENAGGSASIMTCSHHVPTRRPGAAPVPPGGGVASHGDDVRLKLYPAGLLLSAVFLAATLLAGAALPAAHHHALHWRCQTHHVACLLVGDVLLATTQLVGKVGHGVCVTMGGSASIMTCSHHVPTRRPGAVPSPPGGGVASHGDDVRLKLYPAGLLLSAVFLAATLLAGAALPAAHHHALHWRCQTHHVACLLVGDVLLATTQLVGKVGHGVCVTMGGSASIMTCSHHVPTRRPGAAPAPPGGGVASHGDDVRLKLYPAGLLLSAVFLAATLLAGAALPAAHHHALHWRCQTHHVACLLVGDVLLATTQLVGKVGHGVCVTMGGSASIMTCSHHVPTRRPGAVPLPPGGGVASHGDDVRLKLYPAGLLLSAVFLAATLLAGAALPAAHHHALHWRCQTHHVACLLVGDVLLATTQLVGKVGHGVCVTMGGSASIMTCSHHVPTRRPGAVPLPPGGGVASHGDDVRLKLYPAGLLLSAVFLAATLLAGAALPAAHHHALHWRCQTHHVACLLVGDVLLATTQLVGKVGHGVCVTMAIVMHFSFLAAFFWLNTMCFNIWWTFRDLRPGSMEKRAERCRLRVYGIYAWGVPLLISGVALALDSVPDSPDLHFLRPRFGEVTCWFPGDMEIFTYFFCPIGILLIINLLLFAATARELTCGLWKRELVKSTTERAALGRVCMKLVVVMGVTWIADVLSWAVGGPQALWYITDLINALQGVFIFIVVACQPQVWTAIKRLWCRRQSLAADITGNGNHNSSSSHGLPSYGDSVTNHSVSNTTRSVPIETSC